MIKITSKSKWKYWWPAREKRAGETSMLKTSKNCARA